MTDEDEMGVARIRQGARYFEKCDEVHRLKDALEQIADLASGPHDGKPRTTEWYFVTVRKIRLAALEAIRD